MAMDRVKIVVQTIKVSDGSGTQNLGFGSAMEKWVLKGKLNKAFQNEEKPCSTCLLNPFFG